MNINCNVICGLLITLSIFLAATFITATINLGITPFPSFFVTLSIKLLLSAIAITLLKKQLVFRIAMPAINTIIKPVAIALAVTNIINISLTVFTKLLGQKTEMPKALLGLNHTGAGLQPCVTFLLIFANQKPSNIITSGSLVSVVW